MSRPDPQSFREVCGHLPTGVTVIAAHGPDGPVGMAANAVTSVSLDPPLMLVCAGNSSETWPTIRAVGRFCINVMAADQEAVCRRFAEKDIERFAEVLWHRRAAGPGLDGAVAWIECSLREEHLAGDHVIAVGDVVALEARAARGPLVFFRGRYGTFAPEASLTVAEVL